MAHVNVAYICVRLMWAERLVCTDISVCVHHQQCVYSRAVRDMSLGVSLVVFVVCVNGDLDHVLQTQSFTQMINYCLAFEVIKKLINLRAVYF